MYIRELIPKLEIPSLNLLFWIINQHFWSWKLFLKLLLIENKIGFGMSYISKANYIFLHMLFQSNTPQLAARMEIFVGVEPKYSPSRVMQIIKSITVRPIFKQYPGIIKQLWGGELWSDRGYIGTVGNWTTSDVIRNYVENQGNEE